MKVIKATQQMLETRTLVLGFQGENLRTQLRIDCASTFAEYPNATPALAIKPPSGETYPVFVERDGNEVVWDIVANNLVLKGDGELQLTFYKDNVIAKTSIGHITVNRSLQIDGEMPDVVATWIENANRKLAEVDAQIVELEGMVDTATDAATRAEQSASTASAKAEQAAGSAATATEKATEATNAAGTATAKAAEAALSATQANNSAVSAADSERGAMAKAEQAAGSALSASTDATLATEAAQTATSKAGEASASAQSAQASANDAASSATSASASETAAKASETAASTSATQAAQYVLDAGANAQTAMQKAVEASQSATNAEASATNAATSAETASTKAGEAAQSAQAASDAKTAVEQTAEQLAESLEQIEQNTQDIAELDERKANIDGYYPDMTVGNAEQLNSSKYVENSEPYTLRTSGGTSDIGNREYLDAVVGGTVAWNQLANSGNERSFEDNGVTFTYGGGKWSAVGTSTGNIAAQLGAEFRLGSNHAYLCVGSPKNGSANTYSFGIGGLKIDMGNGRIWKNTANYARGYPTLQISSGMEVNFSNIIPQIFDLTQMLGTAVADYIFNLETATAGAGVALFRSWFPKGYYPYNAGELLSVEGLQSHDMVGFNQWDGEWEVGAYDITTGEKQVKTTQIRSKNTIPCLPNTAYYIMIPSATTVSAYAFTLFYDANGNYISNFSHRSNGSQFTTPANTCGMTFFVASAYGTTYKHDICISLAHNNSRNGEYAPYEKHSYPLDNSVILRGIPKVGANGVYWDGDRYLPDGTVERLYGVVDLGTLRWNEYVGYPGLFYVNTTEVPFKVPASNVVVPNAVTANYQAFTSRDIGNTGYTKGYFALASGRIYISNDDYTGNPSEFKAAMQGVMLVYELATPTTESAQPYHSTQWVSDWGTEEFVSTGIVPVGSETRYPANLRDKLQHLPDAASGNGSYLITQTDGQMVLTPFPAPPSTAGNYVLKATVVNGVATYTWEVAT